MASQSAQLTAKVRGELGSRRNKRLRDAGFVPGVIYGHKESEMGLNDVVHISDLKLPDGVRALQDPDQIVCTVKEVAEEETTEVAEAGAAEPEVIGKAEEGAEGAAEGGEAKE